jgi:adenylate cyclase
VSEPKEAPPRGDVLIVDDNPANLSLLSAMLVERGYEVRAAINGAMALKAANAAPPDVILLDVSMPEMDGYEVCRRLKADDLTRAIPIIFVSALDALRDKVAAFEAGGVDYVTKPFQLREVLARVGTQLLLHRQRKELERQRRELEERYLQIQQLQSVVKGYLSKRAWDSIVASAASEAPDAPRAPVRDTLTILISDIAAFVRLSEQRAPGPLFADLNLYMAALTQVVYRNQGEVDKYLGDGILAFFKDARCALLAAYQMQRRVSTFNERQSRGGAPPFGTRIGLATGPVLLASIGTSGRREFTIIGDSVNLAARLQAEAPVGGVLMDRATYEAAAQPSGAVAAVMTIRGKPDPVTMYAVRPEVIEQEVPESKSLLEEEPTDPGADTSGG